MVLIDQITSLTTIYHRMMFLCPTQKSNTYLWLLIRVTQFQYTETIYISTYKILILSHTFTVQLAILTNCIEVLVPHTSHTIALGPKQSYSDLDISSEILDTAASDTTNARVKKRLTGLKGRKVTD